MIPPIKAPRAAAPLPLLTIIATTLTLLILLAISTYRNIDRESRATEGFLFKQGLNVIRALEAGARTGMMRMMWQDEILQALAEEMASRGKLARIMILEAGGRPVADSSPSRPSPWSEWKVHLSKALYSEEPVSWHKGDSFWVAKRFVPLSGGPFGGHGHMMGQWLNRPRRERVAAVEMDMSPYLAAQRRDVRHAFLMGVVLLVIGSASFYFIFVVQNLHLVRRTLQSTTTYLGHVVDHMPDGLISLSPKGEILRVNPQAKTLLGLSHPTPGLSIERLGPPWVELFQRIRRGEALNQHEVTLRDPQGGPLPVSVSASKVSGDNGEDLGVVMLIRDLRDIRELQHQVQRSERLAALGRLAAGVAHEIRNPLSSIKGFAQLFKKRAQEGSDQRRFAEVMIQEVDRLNGVISNLLDFARPKEPRVREASPVEVVNRALELVRRDMEAKGIQWEIRGQVSPRFMDPDQMTQALLNLLLNAMDATPEGGSICVQLCETEGMGWALEISDSGEGIPEQHIPRLFDPFFTTKQTGTGLGLAIVHRIVENHHGTIRVHSDPGRGTRFVLSFPGQPPKAVTETTSQQEAQPIGHGETGGDT